MAKSTLQKIADQKKEIALTGYLGTRVSFELEAAFKNHCKALQITVADALRLLIENELEAANGSPALESPTLEPVTAAPIEGGAAPVVIPVRGRKKRESKASRGTYSAYKVTGPGGAVLMPCPVCKEFQFYKSFFSRHTKKHGYGDTLEFFEAHAETVAEMLQTYNALESVRKKEASEL